MGFNESSWRFFAGYLAPLTWIALVKKLTKPWEIGKTTPNEWTWLPTSITVNFLRPKTPKFPESYSQKYRPHPPAYGPRGYDLKFVCPILAYSYFFMQVFANIYTLIVSFDLLTSRFTQKESLKRKTWTQFLVSYLSSVANAAMKFVQESLRLNQTRGMIFNWRIFRSAVRKGKYGGISRELPKLKFNDLTIISRVIIFEF